MKDKLINFGEVLENEDLKNHTTYKIGGITKFMLKPSNIDNFINAIKYLNEENIPYFILGNGSNLIISNNNYNGVIIKLNLLNNYQIDEENNILNTETGVYLPLLAGKLANLGYSGFEWAGGLPGTIGGSIYGNAEAYKVPISKNLIDVTIFKNNKIIVLKKEDISFNYRTSEFKENKNSIILSAKFKLEKKDSNNIIEIMKNRLNRRLESQPLDYPSAGSVFRNPYIADVKNQVEKYNIPVNESGFISAGYLIEQCSLKGKTIGGAKISEKHANFIININDATSDDIIKLMNLAKENVKEKFEIDLISEQEIINF